MNEEWKLPHEPELLYLRERVQRLEAEVEHLRRFDTYSVTRPPSELVMVNLPREIRIPLFAVAELTREDAIEPIHVRVHTKGPNDGLGYGYYITQQELLTSWDAAGIAAELHKRLLHTLVEHIRPRIKLGG